MLLRCSKQGHELSWINKELNTAELSPLNTKMGTCKEVPIFVLETMAYCGKFSGLTATV